MKGILNLVLGIMGIFTVGYHLAFANGAPGRFFGIEVSSPVYCLIWSTLAIYFLYSFYKMNRGPKQKP